MFSPVRILIATTKSSSSNSGNRFLHTTSRLLTSSKPSTQIDIRTSHPLRSLAERRCLLTALQRFGEVARFVAIKNDRISAIYDTPEAASKATNASPFSILLHHHNHNHTVDTSRSITVHCAIVPASTTTAEEEVEHNNSNNPTQKDFLLNNPNSRRDPRVADVVAAGIPRREFADCLILTKGGDQDKGEWDNTRKSRQKGEGRSWFRGGV